MALFTIIYSLLPPQNFPLTSSTKKAMPPQLVQLIVFCYDVEKLSSFYQRHFGFEQTEYIPHEWAVLSSGGCQLAFHRIGEEYRDQPHPGSFSPAKWVLEVHDLPAIRQQLIQDGTDMQPTKSFNGYPYLLCDGADPEGNIFQLRQKIA
jgi:predicted enzyme related to lactoylglutathione lyase